MPKSYLIVTIIVSTLSGFKVWIKVAQIELDFVFWSSSTMSPVNMDA